MADYGTFRKNWIERLDALASRGVDLNKVGPIVQADAARLQRGEQPLTDTEALSGALTAATGRQVVTEPKRQSGILQLPGNAIHDLGDILTGITKLPGAVINEVKQLPDIPKDIAAADWSSPGAAVRSLTTIPGVRWVPGVQTAANLTTPAGRQSIMQHPLTTALDVLPATGKALELGAGAAVKSGAVDAAEVARKASALKTAAETGREALLPAQDLLTKSERVYQSAAAGRPLSTLLQATGATPLIQRLTDPLTESLRSSTKLSKSYNQLTRAAQLEINGFIKEFQDQIAPSYTQMDDAEKALLYNEWVNPRDYPNPTPEHQAILNAGRAVQDRLANEGIQAGALFPVSVDGRTFIYPKAGEGNMKLYNSINTLAKTQDALAAAQANKVPMPGIVLKYPTVDAALSDLRAQLKDQLTPIQRGALHATIQQVTDYQKSYTTIADLTKQSANARYSMLNNFLTNAPASFHPMLEADIRDQAIQMVRNQSATGAFGQPQLDQAIKSINQGDFKRVFDPNSPVVGQGVFAPGTYEDLVRNIQSGWWNLASQGYDPIFIHNVPDWQPFKANRAKIVTTNEIAPGQFLPKDLFDMSPRYTNVGLALPAGVAEYINRRGTEDFITDTLIPHGLSYEEVLKQEQPQIDRLVSKGQSPESARGQVLSKYKLISDPADFGITSNKITARMGGQELYLPDHVYKAAVNLMKSRTPDNVFSRIATKGTSLFKASIFTLSPRHFADEVFGNFLLGNLGLGGIDDFRNFGKAVSNVTGGMPFTDALKQAWKGELPDNLSPLLSRGIDVLSADQILGYSKGKTLGRILDNAKGVQRVTEFFNNIERSMAQLGEEARQLKSGASPDIARDAGIIHANKAFIDWDSLTPFERNVVKQVFPFYAFTRYVAQYLYQYPADHPLRASIISRIASAERDDNTSGLPGKFNQLFFFGQPDLAGNIKASDVRAINPFRDAANIFTWAGFFSSLSPFAQIPLNVAGVQTLAGTPELYPELSIDPNTGQIVSKRQNIASPTGIINTLSAFLPPVGGALDHFVGISDRIRRLKATDPTGYRRQLLSSLGIPFVPYNVNIPQELTKQQRNLIQVASQRVSEATRQDGSTTELRRYNVVPWQGKLVSGTGLANIIDQLHNASDQSGVPVKMLMAELAKMVK